MMNTPLYQEKSKFPKWVLLLITLPTVGILVYLFFQEKINVDGTDYVSTIVSIIVTVLAFILIFSIQLTLKIYENKISVRYTPFTKFEIEKSNIKSIEVIKINPIRDFGGWGLRKSRKYGKGYTTWGNDVLFVQTKDNKKFAMTVVDVPSIKSIINEKF